MQLYLTAVFIYLITGIFHAWKRYDEIEEFTPAALLVSFSATFFAFVGVMVARIFK